MLWTGHETGNILCSRDMISRTDSLPTVHSEHTSYLHTSNPSNEMTLFPGDDLTVSEWGARTYGSQVEVAYRITTKGRYRQSAQLLNNPAKSVQSYLHSILFLQLSDETFTCDKIRERVITVFHWITRFACIGPRFN